MKKKDINLIMAAVAILVMLKTMINRTFHEMESEDEGFEDDYYNDDDEEEYEDYDDDDDEPYRVSDEEYEHFNEILEDVDFDNLTAEELGDLDLNHLLQRFSDSLEFKLAIMKNSKVLKEMLLKRKEAVEEEVGGEAISDERNG